MQSVLSNHPSFGSPPETHFFRSLARLEPERLASLGVGLSFVLTSTDEDHWTGALWAAIRRSLLAANPGSTRVLEKTPGHIEDVERIRRLVPAARFLLVTRNPIDTVTSLLDAAHGWGSAWAPQHVETAASVWRRAAQRILHHRDDADCLVVRYEDLIDSDAAWRPLLSFVGVPHDWDLPELGAPPVVRGSIPDAEAEARFHQILANRTGFSFHDRDPASRYRLSNFERHYVEATCGDLAGRLGYDSPSGSLGFLDRVRVQQRRARRHTGRVLLTARGPRKKRTTP